jgi:hypothetical protein
LPFVFTFFLPENRAKKNCLAGSEC